MAGITLVQLVQGTHGWGRSADETQWWHHASPFATWLTAQDCLVLGAVRPFIWDTDLDGIGWLHRRPFKKHINWEAAGWALYNYLVPAIAREGFVVDDYVPLADRNLVAHSHALQVVAYGCANGLKINRLLTIGSPVREDMADVYAAALPNIGAWLHVHSDGSDRVQWFGELFDGHFGVVREAPLADRNVLIAKVAHSKLLNDPAAFPLWREHGLLKFLREEPHAVRNR